MAISKEDILDDCIRRLNAGGSIAGCLAHYPHVASLKDDLRIASYAIRIYRIQDSGLDRSAVWGDIRRRILDSKTRSNRGSVSSSIFNLRLPKAMFGIATFVLAIGLVQTTAAAASDSMPGETLYPVKRTMEKIQLTLTIDDVQKAELQMEHARTRLTEAKKIIEANPQQKTTVIKKTLEDLADTTAKAVQQSADNKDLLKKVVELTDNQQAVLAGIEGMTTGDTKEAVISSLDSAQVTKTAAEMNLAKLQDQENRDQASSPATSTPESIKGAQTITPSSTTPSTTRTYIGDKPTSTDDTLNKFGETGATTTDPIIEQASTSTAPTTTAIINLR